MDKFAARLIELVDKKSIEIMLDKTVLVDNLSDCFTNKKDLEMLEKCFENKYFFHALYLTNINEVLFLRYRLMSDFTHSGIKPDEAKRIVDGFTLLAERLRKINIINAFNEKRREFIEALSDALRHYDNGFYKPAFTTLSHLSSSNIEESHYYLGKCFFEGKAVDRDPAKAVQYFTKGVLAGSSDAAYFLGLCLLKGLGVAQNAEKGLELLRKAADMGQEDAVFAVGCMYKDGSGGCKPDIKKAIEYLQKAADYGNWSAAISICELYYEDAKTTGNFHKTSVARQRIQDVKDPEICFKIAQIYERGIGVAPNIEKALNFSAKAAAKNYPGATEMMTRLGNQKLGRI